MSLNHGKVWWSELMTHDPEGARAFYEAVCGWRFEEMPMEEGSYLVAHAHGRPAAGIMAITEEMGEVAPHWMTYIAVADVAAAMTQVKEAGGKMLRAPFHVPDTGWIALVEDASGAMVGLMTPEHEMALDTGAAEDDDPELENVPI